MRRSYEERCKKNSPNKDFWQIMKYTDTKSSEKTQKNVLGYF